MKLSTEALRLTLRSHFCDPQWWYEEYQWCRFRGVCVGIEGHVWFPGAARLWVHTDSPWWRDWKTQVSECVITFTVLKISNWSVAVTTAAFKISNSNSKVIIRNSNKTINSSNSKLIIRNSNMIFNSINKWRVDVTKRINLWRRVGLRQPTYDGGLV